MKPRSFNSKIVISRGRLGRLHEVSRTEKGSQIVEFAMVLPIFLVFTVATFDLGGAFTLRDKMANAAREGARLAVQQSTLDLASGSPPASVDAVAHAVLDYLIRAKVASSGCSLASASSGFWSWTFTGSCPDSLAIKIERAHTGSPQLVANGAVVIMTRVTVSYPARFFLFHRVIELIAPGANMPAILALNSQAIMQNLQ
jgi:hypothetical protein